VSYRLDQRKPMLGRSDLAPEKRCEASGGDPWSVKVLQQTA
jgi:hypothetical protein